MWPRSRQASNDHAAAVAEAIGRSLPAVCKQAPATLVPLLRLLDELLAGVGSALAQEGRPALTSVVAAGGQAGRLARSILGSS